jgi:DNA-binding response OmpR family regulator
MKFMNTLKGKRILVVDDEPDILETLTGLLGECIVDTASDFEAARKLLENNTYDAAILDIMGVEGYRLLEDTAKKGVPALMLTAHALSPDHLVESITKGAHAYIPKDKIAEIEVFLKDILEAQRKGQSRLGRWFSRLEPYFEEKFGADWKKRPDPDFWKKFYYL